MTEVGHQQQAAQDRTERHALLVGRMPEEVVAGLRTVLPVDCRSTVGEARAALRGAQAAASKPRAVILDLSLPDSGAFVVELRTALAVSGLPLIGLLPSPSNAAYRAARALGIDDMVVRDDHRALMARAQTLARRAPPAGAGEGPSNVAVVLAKSPNERALLGRALRLGGWEMMFAHSPDELNTLLGADRHPALLLVDRVFESEAIALRNRYQASTGRTVSLILRCETGSADGLVLPAQHTALLSTDSAPDTVLTLLNDMSRGADTNLRASPRVLYTTLCSFRPEGELLPDYGVTANLSREGLFVRTMNAPARGSEVWVELTPPMSRRPVHLRAEVMWQRATAESGLLGFGARLLEEHTAEADLVLYQEGYVTLLAEVRAGFAASREG